MMRVRLAANVVTVAVVALGAFAPASFAQSVSVVRPASGPAAGAWQALEDGRFRDAESAFASALAAAPDDTTALLGAAMVARRTGKPAAAVHLLTLALRIDPSLVPASQLLGSHWRESGDLEGALRVYDAALVRAPADTDLAARADECRRELARLTRWAGNRDDRARIYFDGPVDDATGLLAADVLRRAFQRVGAALQEWPGAPVTVVLVTGASPAAQASGTPEWSTSQFDGRIRMQVRPPVKDRAEFERMLVHEYAHAVVRPLAPAGVPAWIHEGLAALLEPDGRLRAERDLRSAGILIPFAHVQESFAALPAPLVTVAYAQSALAVQTIVDRTGMRALLALMRDLTAGDRFADAFRARVGITYEQFQQDFAASRRIR